MVGVWRALLALSLAVKSMEQSNECRLHSDGQSFLVNKVVRRNRCDTGEGRREKIHTVIFYGHTPNTEYWRDS
jgi:hypothetical protein